MVYLLLEHHAPWDDICIRHYFHFLDDAFLIIDRTRAQINFFFKKWNTMNSSLYSTWDISDLSRTPSCFLDLEVFLEDKVISFYMFQKELNLYQYIHTGSLHPPVAKWTVAVTELTRYARTCSYEQDFLLRDQLWHRLRLSGCTIPWLLPFVVFPTMISGALSAPLERMTLPCNHLPTE